MSDEIQQTSVTVKRAWPWVLGRLAGIFGILLAISFAFYGLQSMTDPPLVSISFGVLIALPFMLGAIIRFLSDPNGKAGRIGFFAAGGWVILVLVVGGIYLKEGVICMAMLAPLWVTSAIIGSSVAGGLQKQFRERNTLSVSAAMLLPLMLVSLDGNGYDTKHYNVTRSIVVEAPAEQVWPLLVALPDIAADEGAWNISQDILRIPRPTAAVVEGHGVGAVRRAAWQQGVTFEEHILDWQENKAMRWAFAFPNDSVQTHTDRHISPDGYHLEILEGGYRLEALSPSRTRIVLDTDYRATTPVNAYAALWGELFLGDIQTNILHLLKGRAEAPS